MQPVAATQLQLRDIHLPDTSVAWPPATGWWVALILLIAVVVGLYLLIAYLRKPTVKKTALAQFIHIQHAFKTQQNHTLLAQQLHILLRQIVLNYFPREQAASSDGEVFNKQLQSINPKQVINDDILDILTNAAYQQQIEYDADALLLSIEQWLKGLKRRPLA